MVDLDQVIELFTAKHTCELADRHAQSVIALCDQMDNELAQDGFYFCDLEKVANVLKLIHDGIKDVRVSQKSL
jgi:succinate dehydrogenase flavin-adding protein (antitoxin of CptAB toxin-antitoxin module)